MLAWRCSRSARARLRRSSSPDLVGPYPAVTAVIRADADGGRLDLSAWGCRRSIFGPPRTRWRPTCSERRTSGRRRRPAPIPARPPTRSQHIRAGPIPAEGMQLAIDEATVDGALRVLGRARRRCGHARINGRSRSQPRPPVPSRATGVGRLSGRGVLDRQGRRRLDRDARDRARDRGVAASRPRGEHLVLLLIAGITALVWIRRARRRAEVRPSEPPRYTECLDGRGIPQRRMWPVRRLGTR